MKGFAQVLHNGDIFTQELDSNPPTPDILKHHHQQISDPNNQIETHINAIKKIRIEYLGLVLHLDYLK